MYKAKRVLKTKFGPETRFEVRPVPAAPFRREFEDGLERLKNRLLAEKLDGVSSADENSQVRRAANEAAGLAWSTSYPLLVFPALFEEKVEALLAMVEHQATVKRVSRELLAV
jgi:hypothetical protein